eukprot:COSAG05_NODE_5705_length_1111_cov_1.909091_1_plen_145_part_01
MAKKDAGSKLKDLSLGTWNVQGMGWGLLQMLLGAACLDADGNADLRQRAIPQGISVDVLGVTETHWNEKHLGWEKDAKGRFLCGAKPAEGDPAAGVGLVLSFEAAQRLTAWGTCDGGRIIWARFKGAFHDLFVVNTYVPHRGRKA